MKKKLFILFTTVVYVVLSTLVALGGDSGQFGAR